MDNENRSGSEKMRLHHRSRMFQVPIYLGKLFRSFVYQNDWKLLPMSVAVAGLLALVIRRNFAVTMEGTVTGSFALACAAIWNGFFNSIQSVCRERPILKREHRSGMHISAYITANMIYQALLCLIQTVLLLYVCKVIGVHFPDRGYYLGFISKVMVEMGVTIFLVTFSADMMSLFISSLVHSTTAAMTIMPFLLIFQLVFSGGIFTLPSWADSISAWTFSNYGLRCIAAQADYNSLPMDSGWKTLKKMENEVITIETTNGAILDYLAYEENESVESLRQTDIAMGLTLGDVLLLAEESPDMNAKRDEIVTFSFTIKQLIELKGEEEVKEMVQYKSAKSNQRAAFDRTNENIWSCWLALGGLALLFAALSLISLELIDKDRR